jgi:hypothetical protein
MSNKSSTPLLTARGGETGVAGVSSLSSNMDAAAFADFVLLSVVRVDTVAGESAV